MKVIIIVIHLIILIRQLEEQVYKNNEFWRIACYIIGKL